MFERLRAWWASLSGPQQLILGAGVPLAGGAAIVANVRDRQVAPTDPDEESGSIEGPSAPLDPLMPDTLDLLLAVRGFRQEISAALAAAVDRLAPDPDPTPPPIPTPAPLPPDAPPPPKPKPLPPPKAIPPRPRPPKPRDPTLPKTPPRTIPEKPRPRPKPKPKPKPKPRKPPPKPTPPPRFPTPGEGFHPRLGPVVPK